MSDKIKKFPMTEAAKKRLLMKNPSTKTVITRSKKEKEKLLASGKYEEVKGKKKFSLLKGMGKAGSAFFTTLLMPKKAK